MAHLIPCQPDGMIIPQKRARFPCGPVCDDVDDFVETGVAGNQIEVGRFRAVSASSGRVFVDFHGQDRFRFSGLGPGALETFAFVGRDQDRLNVGAADEAEAFDLQALWGGRDRPACVFGREGAVERDSARALGTLRSGPAGHAGCSRLAGALTVHERGLVLRCDGHSLGMRFALYGLILAAVIFLATGGHVLFLPLFFLLPFGGLFGHRRRRRRGF
jgi:hypothetical protein